MHSHRSLDKGDGADAAYLYLLIGVVLVLAYKAYIALVLRLLNILHCDILLAINIYREKVHIAPKYIPNIMQLLI